MRVFGLILLMGISTLAAAAVQVKGRFAPVYTDSSNNLFWTKALPGTFSNGCIDVNGKYDGRKCTLETDANGVPIFVDGAWTVKVDDSDAARACRDIGARLPTKKEIESIDNAV